MSFRGLTQTRTAGPRIPAWLAVACLLWIGCATSWPVSPGDSVKLSRNEGLLLVHLQTNVRLQGLYMDSVRAAGNLADGTHLLMIGATAGEYRWKRVDAGFRTYMFENAEALRFRVAPGVINYVGMVAIEQAGPLQLYMHMIDRTAIGVAALREQYPALTGRHPIVYSGPARHEFLPRLLAAEASREPDDGNDP